VSIKNRLKSLYNWLYRLYDFSAFGKRTIGKIRMDERLFFITSLLNPAA